MEWNCIQRLSNYIVSLYKVFVIIPREWWLNYGVGPRNGGGRIHQDCFGARQRVMQTIGNKISTDFCIYVDLS